MDNLREKVRARLLLSYGDAQTIHTAQGSTRGEQITALPDGSQSIDGLLSYSALTRHIQNSYFVTNERAESNAVRQSQPLNSTRDITTEDKWTQVARALSYQPTRDGALSLSDRVLSMRRGGARQFQSVLLPAEPAHRAPPCRRLLVSFRAEESRAPLVSAR
jgi:hypothetical protein